MRHMDCHEERIHVCGKIQSFGYLFVFDRNEQCIAASENVEKHWRRPAHDFIGKSITELLDFLLPKHSEHFHHFRDEIADPVFNRFVEKVELDGHDYYVSIYRCGENLYLEIEQSNGFDLRQTKLHYYAKHLERGGSDVWKSLTQLIKEIIQFDRVMIYRFKEDKSGQVIAESINNNLDSLLGYRYPEFDIPKQARALYKEFLARHTADTDGPISPLVQSKEEEIDLTHCSVRALSPIHLQYLRNAQVRASASFSIVVDGELWGLVTCQNLLPKHVDLAQRHACLFLTQYAVNYYLSTRLKQETQYIEMTSQLEGELKEELWINNDLLATFNKYAHRLMNKLAADGMFIGNEEEKLSFGEIPAAHHITIIKQLLGQQQENVFATNKCIYREDTKNEETLFPGVIKVDLIPNSSWTLLFFRKEHVVEEIWAGKPEKITPDTLAGHENYPSPRTSFAAWKQINEGASLKWEQRELLFIERIALLVQQSIAKKAGEIQRLNEELVNANNTLDTYSYTLTHDLKNPLSAIRLSAQMIQMKPGLSEEFLKRCSTNILDAVQLMSEMMEKMHEEFAATGSVALRPYLIDPTAHILSIVETAKQEHGVHHLHFELGEVYPVLAERTLLFQLFLNLIGNAIKYSGKEQQPYVKVYSRINDAYISYFIEDNGIGMDLKSNNDIFEIFLRMPNSTGYEGSGVGLSIVKRIVNRLNATIAVESELGKGTLFRVDFVRPR
ncbi:ATP-binding protein [Sphingobacterium chuzhouense]|uniref:histidine kinase n=1 Tax=Sphingobacterium chuzhouense TaxID=1742264 RepID=A0ABR7XPH9_9SPHI|nr:ATP-binding protein [Sphingobacterium chuzhouense]MBD1421079.1 GAF domain-containing protein [Sphingobacterium chuzhouense]